MNTFGEKVNMEQAKVEAIKLAIRKHRKIFPCGGRKEITDCFTVEGNFLYFWFNTCDKSTHLIRTVLL